MVKLSYPRKIKTLSYQDLYGEPGCLEEISKYLNEQKVGHTKEKWGYSYSTYVAVQNIVSVISEYFFNEDRFGNKLLDMIEEVQNLHMPHFPPFSPMTNAYFSYWMHLDARYNGGNTFVEYILKNQKSLKIFDDNIQALTNLSKSRMGVYEHLGFTNNNKIMLKELVTDKEINSINPSGYIGVKGDLCLLRVVDPLVPDDVHVVLTTPYILVGHGKQEWESYFERQGVSKSNSEEMNHFMKHWPTFDYWHEFIFEGYSGYESSQIYLKGIPDIKGTKPHEKMP